METTGASSGTISWSKPSSSKRHFKFDGFGGTSQDLVDSPIFTLTQALGHYNAPYFDATDPEERNNQQLTGNVTSFLNTENRGRHELKVGYEWFRSQRTGGNSQSSTGYVIMPTTWRMHREPWFSTRRAT